MQSAVASDQESRRQRFLVILQWMRKLRVCWLCGMRMAILAVDYEYGDNRPSLPESHCMRIGQHPRNMSCEAIVKTHWEQRPR